MDKIEIGRLKGRKLSHHLRNRVTSDVFFPLAARQFGKKINTIKLVQIWALRETKYFDTI